MKICHSSDWHLGHTLYGQRRYTEQTAFLDWLKQLLQQEKVELLLVAGDIYDSSAAPLQAQAIYYQFLAEISAMGSCQIIIIGGNHDSPGLLNAPHLLLKALNIHVVGDGSKPEDELIVIPSNNPSVPEIIVCAVPFLREQEIRKSRPGEGSLEKEAQLQNGILQHYSQILDAAEKLQKKLLGKYRAKSQTVRIPIITMGHLYTKGGQLREGEGVRGLYVGSLARFDAALFENKSDYVALGHLHIPQKVGQNEFIRYSGSPLPMGFNEANQSKQVMLVDFALDNTSLKPIEVPVFQKLKRISGDFVQILNALQELAKGEEELWLELLYTGDELIPRLQELFEKEISGSALKILRLDDQRKMKEFASYGTGVNLQELDEKAVFQRCLDAYNIPEAQQTQLFTAYEEILHQIKTEDSKLEKNAHSQD